MTGDTVSFNNLIRLAEYWYGTEAPDNRQAWVFSTHTGHQHLTTTTGSFRNYVWAVRDGDVAGSTGPNPAPVPEPASLALFGLGLLGLSMRERRRKLNKH